MGDLHYEKEVKHPKEMTTDEAIADVFHPKALKTWRSMLEKLSEKKPKGKSKCYLMFFQAFS